MYLCPRIWINLRSKLYENPIGRVLGPRRPQAVSPLLSVGAGTDEKSAQGSYGKGQSELGASLHKGIEWPASLESGIGSILGHPAESKLFLIPGLFGSEQEAKSRIATQTR